MVSTTGCTFVCQSIYHSVTPRTVAFHTLGCKLNFSETSTLRQQFEGAGFGVVGFRESADIYVLNTCSVTEHADKKCRQEVRRAMRQNPSAQVVVTGCYAQLKPEEIANIEGVDLVLGAAEKFRLLEYVDQLSTTSGKAWIVAGDVREADTFVSSASFGDRTRSFLKVQDGCDYKCTFCTIPQARGASRSDTVSNAVASAKTLGAQGVREIVLTGCNLGDFGNGTAVIEGTRPRKEALFVDLVKALDEEVTEVPRFRISSIEPNLCTDEVIDIVAKSARFMPHFHMPLQSGCNATLARMSRRYKKELYEERVRRIRKRMPYACIGVDVIVGFPGETQEEFNETVAFLEGLEVSYFHVFTYSERDNTPAASMGGVVPVQERRRRNAILTELSAKKRKAFDDQHQGTVRSILWEIDKEPSLMAGWTDNYVRVKAPRREELLGFIEDVVITQHVELLSEPTA